MQYLKKNQRNNQVKIFSTAGFSVCRPKLTKFSSQLPCKLLIVRFWPILGPVSPNIPRLYQPYMKNMLGMTDANEQRGEYNINI